MFRWLMIWILSLVCVKAISQVRFEEIAGKSGLIFRHGEYLLLGGGIAVFDFDNDQDEDLYVTGGLLRDNLFINDGTGNFTEEGEKYGLSITNNIFTTSVATGDIDNDGIREIFVGTLSENSTPNSFTENLLLKLDGGQLKNIAPKVGIDNKSFCMGGHFFDANLDGYLDLYIINYVETPNYQRDADGAIVGFLHQCGFNRLYINDGQGSFEEQAVRYGVANGGCSLAVTSSDIDFDGDQDLIVANDFGQWIKPNAVYLNLYPEARFKDIGEPSGTDARMYGMGIATGDPDEDLDMDFYVTNIGANPLFLNQADNTFLSFQEAPIEDEYTVNGLYTTGWGAFFADLNNDTFLDLFVANGFVDSEIHQDDPIQKSKCFMGNGDRSFVMLEDESGLRLTGNLRGAAYGDFNNDGLLDIVAVSNKLVSEQDNNYIRYFENRSASQNWIGFTLKGCSTNKDAFGVKAIVYAEGRAFLREITGGSSHASQTSSKLHFGLGSIKKIDSVEIYWKRNHLQSIYNPQVNQYHHMVEKWNLVTGASSIENQDNFQVWSSGHQVLTFKAKVSFNGNVEVYNVQGQILDQMYMSLEPNEERRIQLKTSDRILIVCLRDSRNNILRKIQQME